MMFDANLTFSDAQSLVATAGAILSDKSIDLWGGARQTDTLGNTPISDPGRGAPIRVVVVVTTSFTSTGSDVTLYCELVMADDAALTSNLTVVQTSQTVTLPLIGQRFHLSALPEGISKRYLGVRYTTAVHDATAGKVTAGLVLDADTGFGSATY